MPLYADLCVRLQNASRARLRSVAVSSSKDNLAILSILLQHGFIHTITRGTVAGPCPTSWAQATTPSKRFWVDLKYRPDETPVLEHMNVISKPSRKLDMDHSELVRFATGRRAKFVTPLNLGEIGIINCKDEGWWEVRDAIKRNLHGEVVARVS